MLVQHRLQVESVRRNLDRDFVRVSGQVEVGGSASASRVSPLPRTSARSITFSSSRMLPGQR